LTNFRCLFASSNVVSLILPLSIALNLYRAVNLRGDANGIGWLAISDWESIGLEWDDEGYASSEEGGSAFIKS
jgi:hypothetical protein